MKELTKEQLIATAKDLEGILFKGKPEIGKNWKGGIDGGTVEQLELEIKEAAELLDPNDVFAERTIETLHELFMGLRDELEKLEKRDDTDENVIEVFEKLGILDSVNRKKPIKKEEEVKPEKEDSPDNDNVQDRVKGAERLKDLRDIAKEYDEFKAIRGQLSRYKVTKELRKDMFTILRKLEDEQKETTHVPAPATEKKPEEVKTTLVTEKKSEEVKIIPKKKEEEEKKQIETTIPIPKEKDKKVESITRAAVFAKMFHEDIPRTMNELVDEMMKQYHSGSLSGAKTFVPIYVSILKELGMIEKNKKGEYIKAT